MESTKTNIFDYTEKLGKSFAFFGISLLVVSVAYDFFFFAALNLSLDEIPTVITDHVRSALVWAPQLILISFVVLLYHLFMRRVEGGRTEQELIDSSNHPRLVKYSRKATAPVFGLALSLFVLQILKIEKYFQLIFLILTVVWGFLASSIVNHSRMGAVFTKVGGFAFLMFPLLLLIVGLNGYQAGIKIIEQKKPRWEVRLREGESFTTIELLGLRRFGSFTVFVEKNRLVRTVSNDSIASLILLESPYQQKPVLCRWFNYCEAQVEAKK